MIINKILRHSFLFFLLTAVVTSGLFVFAPSAIAGEESWYVAQMKTGNIATLSGISNNILEVFPESKSPLLANTYRFSSLFKIDQIKLALHGQVNYLEAEGKLKTAETAFNDPWFTKNPIDTDRQWGIVKTKFIDAWNKTTGNRKDIIAVIDTGIDQTHEDLAGANFVAGYDFVSKVPILPNTNSDDNGHGTLIAGILAAKGNNNLGIVGLDWNATLMPLKTLDASGEGSASLTSSAIVWAADHGAGLINLSLGGLGFSQDTALANAISYAFRKNVIIVAAAGNDSTNATNLDATPVFPVCDDNGENMVIGVTALDVNDTKPNFANFGQNCIDVSAPGKRIISTINHDPITHRPSPNSYAYASGTSLAVPFVVAEAALLKAFNPLATNKQIHDRIITTADNVDGLNVIACNNGPCDNLLGSGRINAMTALSELIDLQVINEGEVVLEADTGKVYLISGGKKRPLSQFVQNQRFSGVKPTVVNSSKLKQFTEGSLAEPLDGTLIKSFDNPTVYYMSRGVRLPVTGQIFSLRQFKFSNVIGLDITEVNSWIVGSLLTPVEGSLVKAVRSKTVYWVVGGSLHPISYNFYISRGLQIFPIIQMNISDISAFSRGEPFL